MLEKKTIRPYKKIQVVDPQGLLINLDYASEEESEVNFFYFLFLNSSSRKKNLKLKGTQGREGQPQIQDLKKITKEGRGRDNNKSRSSLI